MFNLNIPAGDFIDSSRLRIEIDNLFVLYKGDIFLQVDLSWGLCRMSAVEILEYDFLLLQQHFILKSMPQLS